MLPNLAETIILLVICIAIFGLGKAETLGELAWRIRTTLDPSLEETDAQEPSPTDPTDSETP